MKKIALLLIAIVASSACQKKTPIPVAVDNSAAIKAEQIAAEIKDMEQQEEKLRREIELEKLAMEREDLRRQREELDAKSRNLSVEELALERKKTELAEQRVNDALDKVKDSKTPLRAEPVDLPERQSPSYNQPVSVNTNDYDYSVFYNRLSSYGSWFNSPQYGYIWQPSNYQASRDWRPYTNGHWVYSNLGWTWVSSEPFGWATYHYGRWVLLRNTGWCWVPGNQWAPAWVAWRNNGNYVGWAPLPPETLYFSNNEWSSYYGDACGISPRCFTFVRNNHFGSSIYSNVYSVSDCVQIYSQTTYIGGYRYSGNQVICTGISYQFACQSIGRDLPRYECEFNGRPPTTLDPLRYVATRGNRLEFNAPSMGSAWNSALRPKKFEKSLDNDQVVREANINERVLTGFSSARKRDREVADTSLRGGLAQKMTKRIELEEKIAEHRGELAESKNKPKEKRTELLPPVVEPLKDTSVEDEKKDLAAGLKGRPSRPSKDRDQVKEGQIVGEKMKGEKPRNVQPTDVQPTDVQPKGEQVPVAPVEPTVPSETTMKDRPNTPDRGETPQPDRGGLDRLEQQRELLQKQREQKESELRQQQEQAAMSEKERQAVSKEQEKIMREREKVAAEMEKEQRKAQEQAAEKMVQEQARAEKMKDSQESADGKEQRKRMQEEAELAQKSEKRMREQQEAATEAQKEQIKAQQEAAREAQQEQMKTQQLEAAREAQQQDRMKAQNEAAREEQMKAQREAAREAQQLEAQQEKMRQQQQEAAREAQQEQMKAQQQEAAREAQQEQMRQQQEAAREAQQEQMRQQQEAAREQQMRQQQEAAREAQQQAQQEQMRQQQQEAAREQQMRQQQQEAARQQQQLIRQQQDSARESQQNQLREQKRQEQQQQSQQQQPRDLRRGR